MNTQQKTYFIEANGSRAYFKYDTLRNSVLNFNNGTEATISPEKFADFINTAKLLGLNAGEL